MHILLIEGSLRGPITWMMAWNKIFCTKHNNSNSSFYVSKYDVPASSRYATPHSNVCNITVHLSTSSSEISQVGVFLSQYVDIKVSGPSLGWYGDRTIGSWVVFALQGVYLLSVCIFFFFLPLWARQNSQILTWNATWEEKPQLPVFKLVAGTPSRSYQ